MRVNQVRREAKRLSCLIESKGGTDELFFEFSETDSLSPAAGGNWIVAALLLSCMKQGEALEMEEPVSPALLRNLETIQAIYKAWIPGHSAVQVVAPAREQPAGQGRVGLLFSRGVDSFYSLLKHDPYISDLVVIHGFDFLWKEQATFHKHLDAVRAVAEGFKKRLIVVRTNVYDYLVQHTHWDFSHGAALVSAALCLEGTLSKCFVASTCSYDELHPWGSHPLLDPLWSTATLQFLHDGSEARRLDKLRRIADEKLAMKYLRACDNPSSSGFCGQCEKCLRTMVGLHVIGKLGDFPALPHYIDPGLVRRLRLDEGTATFFREFLRVPIEPPPLRRAIYYALRSQRFGLRPANHVFSIRSRMPRLADMARLIRRVLAGPG